MATRPVLQVGILGRDDERTNLNIPSDQVVVEPIPMCPEVQGPKDIDAVEVRARFSSFKVLKVPALTNTDAIQAVAKAVTEARTQGLSSLSATHFLLAAGVFSASDLPRPLELSLGGDVSGRAHIHACMDRLLQSYKDIGSVVKNVALKLFPHLVNEDDRAVMWDIKHRQTATAKTEKLVPQLHIDDFPEKSEYGQLLIKGLSQALEALSGEFGSPKLTGDVQDMIDNPDNIKMSFNVWVLLSDDDRASPLVFADPEDCELIDLKHGEPSNLGQLAKLGEKGKVRIYTSDMMKAEAYMWLTWSLESPGSGVLGSAVPHAGARHERTWESPPRESIDIRFAIVAPKP